MRALLRGPWTALLLLFMALPVSGQVNARLLRYPAVSATHIAFVYAGDIWVVGKNGGVAHRLSSPAGEEMFPRFSPDGGRIAFTGNYDGNPDIYVIPAMGGTAERLTYHPEPDRVIEWSADGRILFASPRTAEKDRFNKLYRIGASGGMPEELPLPFGEFGSIAPDGRTLAYTHHSGDFRTWKRYRGGFTTDIWLFDLESKTSKKVPGENSTDTQPLWHGTTLYFLSDRGPRERMNLWSYDTRTEQLRQVTHFLEHDVRFPSIGPADIVFENGGRLHLLPLAGGEPRAIDVSVVTDLASVKPRVEKVSRLVQGIGISPTGMRAVVEARGDVFTLPAEHGTPRTLTQSSSSAERYPAWSPDGRQIAYWSDRTGEYELTLRNADGSGTERTVTRLGPGFRYGIFWSPDARQIAFIDQAMQIHVLDVASGNARVIDRANAWAHGNLNNFDVSWSPDSRWVTYSRDVVRGRNAVFIYDTRGNQLHQVTAGFYAATEPVFDPEGKYLYFLTDRSFTPVYSAMDNSWVYANPQVIAAVPLRRNVPSPLDLRSDEEPARDPSAPAPAPASGGAAVPKPPPAVAIDFDDFERRVVVLPPTPGNYGELQAVAGKVLYHRHPRTGTVVMEEKQPIMWYDLKERKEETLVEDATTFMVSADGKKMLVRHRDRYAIVNVAVNQKLEKTLAMDALERVVDPREEWRQIFADAWRLQRDYFYDPGMHGVDWEGMRRQYGALLEHATTREDVNFVIGELIAELNASHTYRGGGALEEPLRRGVGMLGADFALENGAYRIVRIIDGAPWDSEVRSPLRQPGVNVAEGDYVLAVNGTPVDVTKEPWAALQGLAGQTVSLMVNSRPTLDGARSVLVQTLGNEGRLRNLAWIEANRRRVDEASGGRVGYIYVPDTGVNGQTELIRQFYGQFGRDGLVIDERFNSGGQIPDRFVELLNRPITNFWAIRDGTDWQWPPVAHAGPKAMLINEWSGSGGDAFPFYFKQAGLGPLIGKRTWGGLIGISGVPPLVDGGGVTVPTFAIYSEGQWIIENHGVEPDIEVEADPARMWDGGDPQLDRAVQEVMRQLQERPPVRPSRPAYPVRAPT
ncbi:MAG TPA: PDZ domain-containing protein, partial [Longimicrobiales bacterium]|nr:PDZ domain-containing protein [Longimicrobiales bacterium]